MLNAHNTFCAFKSNSVEIQDKSVLTGILRKFIPHNSIELLEFSYIVYNVIENLRQHTVDNALVQRKYYVDKN